MLLLDIGGDMHLLQLAQLSNAHFTAPSHGIRSETAPESLLVRNASRW
jgi:hypothetical protein